MRFDSYSVVATIAIVAVLLHSVEAASFAGSIVRRDASDSAENSMGDEGSANTQLFTPEDLQGSRGQTDKTGIRTKHQTGEEGAEKEADIGSYNGLVDKSSLNKSITANALTTTSAAAAPSPTTSPSNSASAQPAPTAHPEQQKQASSNANSITTTLASSSVAVPSMAPNTATSSPSSTVTSVANAAPSTTPAAPSKTTSAVAQQPSSTPKTIAEISNSGQVTYVPESSVRPSEHCFYSTTKPSDKLGLAGADNKPNSIAAYTNVIALSASYSRCVGTHRACYQACGVNKGCCDEAFIKCGRETCARINAATSDFSNCENDWQWTGSYAKRLHLTNALEFGCPAFNQAQVQCKLQNTGFLGCLPPRNWGAPSTGAPAPNTATVAPPAKANVNNGLEKTLPSSSITTPVATSTIGTSSAQYAPPTTPTSSSGKYTSNTPNATNKPNNNLSQQPKSAASPSTNGGPTTAPQLGTVSSKSETPQPTLTPVPSYTTSSVTTSTFMPHVPPPTISPTLSKAAAATTA
ncbi:hypothetical protein BDF19DRAFT_431698, partial [Syncephalis fuscata]